MNVSSPNPDQREPPSLAQRNAYETLLSKQDRIRDAMLVALMDKYARWRANWADAMGEQIEELMPAVSDPTNFRVLIGLSNIHVLNVEREGRAYVGFELGCTWDDEHGLGFMTHGDRVVKVGGADTSFLEWIAERDVKAT